MKLKTKIKAFTASFLITAIFIAGLYGFIMVDIRSDRYMPGQIEPMFQISNVGAQGLDVFFMGQRYSISALLVSQSQAWVWQYRALLPRDVRTAILLWHLLPEGEYFSH